MRKANNDLWNPADYDDEPRTNGKSGLDLFRESCEAADRARRGEMGTSGAVTHRVANEFS
ncbi:MAG TPA: hypothetical protein VD837_17665 [Terriglobales bacterium]|nr:hypothetical protein [Terriglobales bacterium]